MKECYRKNIIDLAMIQLDKPYVWGATGPDAFDCSGFAFYIFKELFGIDINKTGYGVGDTTKQMTNDIGILRKYKEDDENKSSYLQDISVGDLIFFHRQSLEDNQPTPFNRYPGHVGIYLGNHQFIHAASSQGKIVISDVDDYWLSVMVASRDIISGIL